MEKDIKFITEKPIAHRGLHSDSIPENSIQAFECALNNMHPIELDVQMTRDGYLVVFHDWKLDRMIGKEGRVSRKDYADIRNYYLNNSDQGIPLFEDVLKLIDGTVPIIVEIKSKSYFNFKICEKIYDLLKNYSGKYAISSFNPFAVLWFKKNAPDIVRGQNFTNFKNKSFFIAFYKKIFLYFLWIISNNSPDFFACRANTLPNFWPAKVAKKRNKLLLTWKIEDDKEYDRIRHVIDNEFFDNKSFV